MKKLVVSVAAVALTAVGVPQAHADDRAEIVHVAAIPVTTDKVVIGVQVFVADGAEVSVTDATGRTVGTAAVTDGKAVVPVASKGGEQRYVVTVGDARTGVRVRHDESSLRSSPWAVVNKQHAFGAKAPTELQKLDGVDLTKAAHAAYGRMLRGAQQAGAGFWLASGYRPFADQRVLYDGYVKRDGVKRADAYSARPGHSEHQTGLAIDVASEVCTVSKCFADTPAGRWLAEHAAEYGFIIRYPKGAEKVTGYDFEPWHLRYVGPWLAGHLKQTKQPTMEKAFGLREAPTYVR